MQYPEFFNEIFSGHIISRENDVIKYLAYLNAIREGQVLDLPERTPIQLGIFDAIDGHQMDVNHLDNQDIPEQSVLIIPIHGMMTRFGSWWDYGMDEIAMILNQAWENESIKSVVIDFRTDGGTKSSVVPLRQALAKKNKPVIGAINDKCHSAGFLVASYCDELWAVDDSATVGSIGVMQIINDTREMDKMFGIKQVIVIPPESEWKNKAYYQARDGKKSLLIKEELTPLALWFRDIVTTNRPQVDETVEGILAGRDFFAGIGEVPAVDSKLIDGIKPFDEIVQYAANYDERKLFQTL